MFSPDKFLVTEIIEAATEPLRAYVPFHPAVKSMSTPDVWSAKISVSFEMGLNPCVIFSCPPVFSFGRQAGRPGVQAAKRPLRFRTSCRGRRGGVVRGAGLYSAESTRVLAAEYAGGLRTALRRIGPVRGTGTADVAFANQILLPLFVREKKISLFCNNFTLLEFYT